MFKLKNFSYAVILVVAAWFLSGRISLTAEASFNDDFDYPTVIGAIPFSESTDTSSATYAGDEPFSCSAQVGATVWYQFTPASEMWVNISTAGSNYSTEIAIYTGTRTGLEMKGCTGTGSLNLNLEASQVHYIRIASTQPSPYSMERPIGGNLVLNIIQVEAPPHDNFANADPISMPFSIQTSDLYAGTEAGEPIPTCGAMENPGKTIWFSFTPGERGLLYGSIYGMWANPILAIYTGEGFPLVEDYCARAYSMISFTVQAGVTYYFQISSLNNTGGEIEINLNFAIPPINDNFADAIEIPALPYSDTRNTYSATREDLEPTPSCTWNTPEKTIWYTYVPQESGPYYLILSPQNASILAAVYEEETIGTLIGIGCTSINEMEITLPLEAGKRYYFQVIGNNIATEIRFDQLLQPANDHFANLEELTLPVQIDSENREATVDDGEPKSSCVYGYDGNQYRTVWYGFQAKQSGGLYLDFTPSWDGGFAAVYWSGEGEALTELQCSQGGDLMVNIQSGGIYYIQAGSIIDRGGDFSLDLSFVSPPANDNFVNAEPILYLPDAKEPKIASATVEPDEPAPSCISRIPTNTIWYSFQATESGRLAFAAQPVFGGTGFIAVYTKGDSGELLEYECFGSWFNPIGLYSKVQAGKSYYIQIGSSDYDGGWMRFNYWFIYPPQNDNFYNATQLQVPANTWIDSSNASLEMQEPIPSCARGQGFDKTIWLTHTSAQKGFLNGYFEGGYYSPSILAIYSGSSLENLNEEFCGENYVSFSLLTKPGTTYYFQIGGLTGFGVQGGLNINFYPSPSNDDFAQAEGITGLPYKPYLENSFAALEAGEPSPNCVYDVGRTVWYAYTPEESGSVTFWASDFYYGFVAVYTGGKLSSLVQVSCARYNAMDTIYLEAGKTYFFQAGSSYYGGWFGFHLITTPPPFAGFDSSPLDPSTFDTIQPNSSSYDPVKEGLSSFAWDFGDGTMSSDENPLHRYTKDGDYTVHLGVTTPDDRYGETSQVLQVRTHNVAIYRFLTPASADAEQKRQITVYLLNQRYRENVRVELYKSTPSGFIKVGEVELNVPVRQAVRTTPVNFYYTFTKADAAVGKVTFKVGVTLLEARDIMPLDNEVISSPTKVRTKIRK